MSTTMSEADHNGPLLAAANTTWLEYAKGTWSETDKRIFMAGWEACNNYRRQLHREQQIDLEIRRRVQEGMDGRG